MKKHLATGAGVTAGATLLMGGAAQAATFTVGSSADTSGATDCAVATNTDCTLRDAIEDANGDAGSTITFASGLTGEITLTSGLPILNVAMTVSGPGAGQLAVSGDDANRVFDVDTPPGADVLISGLTIAHGATLSVGAGIRSKYADLTLRDAVVSDNHAEGPGGGVGIYDGGTLTIEDSVVSDNTVTGDHGAGVYTASTDGIPATVRNTTITGNTGADFGGGLYFSYTAAATLENSTVYDNSAGNSGGGVYHYGRRTGEAGLTVTGSTITHNSAARGGGLASYGGVDATQPTIRDTIVSDNAATKGSDVSGSFNPDPLASIKAAFSLIGSVDPDSPLDQTGPNLIGQDPLLGALADNGGPGETQKPAATSPVVDAGSAFGLGTDERGLARTFDAPTIGNVADGTDIGAIELQAGDVPPAPVVPVTTHKKKCKKHKKKHKRSADSAKKKKCKKKKKKKQ
jgi:hypothetical protein